jgi:hypothetical protein
MTIIVLHQFMSGDSRRGSLHNDRRSSAGSPSALGTLPRPRSTRSSQSCNDLFHNNNNNSELPESPGRQSLNQFTFVFPPDAQSIGNKTR